MLNLFRKTNNLPTLTETNIESRVVGVCINSWFGVKKATYGNFDNVLELENILRDDYISQVLPLLVNYDTIIFNGMTELFSELINRLKDKRIFVMYHGSPTLHTENQYENFMFKLILEKSSEKKIDGIIFVKSGLQKFFAGFGHNTFYLPNKVGELYEREIKQPETFKIGVLSQHLLWNKNLYNQVLAVISLENAEVYINVDKNKLGYLATEQSVRSVGVIKDSNEFRKFLSSLDINLNVTLTEAYPMNLIESLQVGIPCLTSRTNNIYDLNSILSNYLIVDEFDNANAIAIKLNEVMKNYEEIVKEIMEFRQILKLENEKLWDKFLTRLNETN